MSSLRNLFMKIEDNFIKAEEFSALHKLFSDLHFNWFYAPSQAYWDDKEAIDERAVDNKPIFQHGIFVQQQASYAYPYVQPIIKKLGIDESKILRIQANLCIHNDNVYYSDWHTDYPNTDNKFKTAVYYINSCNGGTEFKDGEIVNSVGNRIVIFDGSKEHRSKSQTDTKRRMVININYKD